MSDLIMIINILFLDLICIDIIQVIKDIFLFFDLILTHFFLFFVINFRHIFFIKTRRFQCEFIIQLVCFKRKLFRVIVYNLLDIILQHYLLII